jgi:hypothetical protein
LPRHVATVRDLTPRGATHFKQSGFDAAMPTEFFETREYPSPGECIYCGRKADEVELTDEHIVPYSLGGNWVIREASCKPCAAETSKVEAELGRKVLMDFRTHANVQTRRPKERPTELKFEYSIASGPAQTKTVPVADHPYFTPLPVWGMPGLLQGKTPTAQFEHHKAHVFYWLPPNIRETIGLSDGDIAEIPFPEFRINHEYCARAIAKIAYCQTIAQFGLHGFRHLAVPDLILGRYPYIPYWVGCKIDDPPPPADRKVVHVLQVGKETVNGISLVVTTVRLFANSGVEGHGPPIYEVVVGAPPLRKP